MPCDTATARRCRRTPNRSTRCTGTLYCAAFSRALSHCTIATVGRPVHSGAAIDDTGRRSPRRRRRPGACAPAAAASACSPAPVSAGCGPRRRRRGRTARRPARARHTRGSAGPARSGRATRRSAARSRASAREPPPEPGIAGSSKPRWRITSRSPPSGAAAPAGTARGRPQQQAQHRGAAEHGRPRATAGPPAGWPRARRGRARPSRCPSPWRGRFRAAGRARRAGPGRRRRQRPRLPRRPRGRVRPPRAWPAASPVASRPAATARPAPARRPCPPATSSTARTIVVDHPSPATASHGRARQRGQVHGGQHEGGHRDGHGREECARPAGRCAGSSSTRRAGPRPPPARPHGAAGTSPARSRRRRRPVPWPAWTRAW